MPTTIKRTEEVTGPCPFRAEGLCTGDDCALWNDDLDACGLSTVSLQLLMKTAITDAAVEVIGAYKEKNMTQRTVPVILEGEARVLTLEEIRTLPKDCGVPVCVEQRYPIGKYDGGSYIKWLGSGFVNEEYMTDNRWYNQKTYNIAWRCWSTKPTDAQREAAPWEAGKP